MLNDPHDRFFKAVIARPALAATLLRDLLPDHLARHVDFDTLARRSENAVDHRLGVRFSDLLFTARQRNADGRILFLFEHRSSPEPLLPLRVYRYAGDALEDHRKRHPKDKHCPGIFVVVVHHGKRAQSADRFA